jgi:hypothetical protein
VLLAEELAAGHGLDEATVERCKARMTERYVHTALVAFPGAAKRGEDRVFAKVDDD